MIAQLVEHDLAKVGVASSSLVHRSAQQNPDPLRGPQRNLLRRGERRHRSPQ